MDGVKMRGLIMNHKKAKRHHQMSQKGFSLIEVMIALVVLLIGMLGVMSMQYYAIKGNASSRELRIATDLSRDAMEELETVAYANLADGFDNPFGDIAAVEPTISGGETFTRVWWVVPNCIDLLGNGNTCAPAGAPGCVESPDNLLIMNISAVRTRTCWTDKHGVMHSVSLDSVRVEG
jgi:prepilin-type N-terminal cleavage/methylation domain-containing protein